MAVLRVEVFRVEGRCEVFKVGNFFVIEDGWVLKSEIPLCMHALSSLMPFYIALSRGVEPSRLGLSPADGSQPNTAFLRCPDPCDITNGGTVTFRIKLLNSPNS